MEITLARAKKKTETIYNSIEMKIPFPTLSYDIRRKSDERIVKVREYPFDLDIIDEILNSKMLCWIRLLYSGS
ncbi:MAG: hypothetical protein QXN34_02820 [Archaeoglobaceae archaeon]